MPTRKNIQNILKFQSPNSGEFLKYFVLDLGAQTIALLRKLNRNTVNLHLLLIRQRIANLCEEGSPFQGEIEVDETLVGGVE